VELPQPNSTASVNRALPTPYRRGMEAIIGVALIFLLGYAAGRQRIRHRRVPTRSTPSSTARHTNRQVHRQNTREREYGGFGALGAANDHGDVGDGGF
jgi:hypothetical protein